MVNAGITAALIAASHQEEVEQKVEARLKKANAVTPASAIQLDLKEKEQALLDQAIAGGTVKRAADGRVYLNEMAVADRKEGQGFMALLILLITGSLIASVIALLERSSG